MHEYIIPDDLARFFGMPFGTIMSRTELTEKLHYKIVGKGLFDPAKPRRILPDDELTLLLQIPYGQELTFVNLQTFLMDKVNSHLEWCLAFTEGLYRFCQVAAANTMKALKSAGGRL